MQRLMDVARRMGDHEERLARGEIVIGVMRRGALELEDGILQRVDHVVLVGAHGVGPRGLPKDVRWNG